ncbi:MAG: VWA domain-containing protein [Opitutales bacterium]|nr:VWA domain-containing protein [Opitutales bacterium]
MVPLFSQFFGFTGLLPEIIHPGWIWLVLFLPFLWLWARRSLDPLSPLRRTLALIVRSALVLLLLAALLDPRIERSTDQDNFLWLVDVSDSLGDNAWQAYQDLPESWRELPGQHQLLLFAGETQWFSDASGPEHFFRDPLDPRRTDLANALRMAEATRNGQARNHLILLSDGRPLDADWTSLAQRFSERSLPIHTYTVDPPDDPEVLVRSLRAPSHVRQSEPFSLRAEVVSNREQEARVRLYRSGALVYEKKQLLENGTTVFTMDQTIERENLAEFSFWVDAPEDTHLDNNQRSVFVHAQGASRILLLTDEPRHARYLSLALQQEGIQLDTRPAEGAPSSLGDLQNYDLLILDNIPATALQTEQLELIRSYIMDFGGGLLMLGGDQSFGLGGYHRSPLRDVLPLYTDYQDEEESPSVALALVLDKSGSMSGERIEMARAAAIGAVELLTPTDFAGVIAFDGEARWVAEMQPLTDPYRLNQLIESIEAGGGTNLAPGMQMALDGLRRTPARIKHAIILSDGHSVPGEFNEIASRMARENISVSTVGVGQGVDVELLREIARLGQGRYYYTESNRDIPQIMAQETMTATGSAIQELPFAPVINQSADFLAGIDMGRAPFLYGYVRTMARETANTWLLTEDGHPLFASWRYGLGQVGAFTSDARNRWALEWLRWPAYSRFWAQTIRHLQRSPSENQFSIDWEQQENGYHLTIETISESGRWLDHRVEGRILALREDGNRQTVPTESVAPGRHHAFISDTTSTAQHLDIRFIDTVENRERNHQFLTLHPSFSDEYLLRPADHDFMAQLSQQTGGTVLNEEQTLPAWTRTDDRTATRSQALWPWLVALALLLFFLDLALKRWPDPNAAPGLVRFPFPTRKPSK